MNYLIVVAGGKGERMGFGFNKVFVKLGRRPLIYWTLAVFEKSKSIDKIIISAGREDIEKIKKLIKKYKFKKVRDVIGASFSRQESTFVILDALKKQIKGSDLVGVHNGANPFVSNAEISRVFKNAKRYGAALLAQAARDTVKISNDQGRVSHTPLKQYCWYAQTPQVATFADLWRAHSKAKGDNFVGTDDAQLLERVSIKPKIVPCSHMNFKITFPQDLATADYILKTWAE
ncbi:MAG: 2-C-methyl-D-erythritol 4-phosphate cytidylyltransferase [Candidatus Curtissbacteria bacterium]|nr:2-C-methyl-D-erythritol 4-phosphate cytidylyltransferase [Candidatus Curtissbacteria bacterium]